MAGKSFLFFSAAIITVGAFFILGTGKADAYAVTSTGHSIVGQASTLTGVNSNYNFDGSFQNLVSPFQSFFQSLKWNTSATTQIYPTSTVIPSLNISPSLQNTLTQSFTDFDNWFYGLTGMRLSGIIVVILNIISWALGLILGVVNWLLGLFH
jgi:hypothetical protein